MSKRNNNSGTWFLSYLCEIGVIKNDDTVEFNCVTGKLLKEYFGLPINTYVYIRMDNSQTLDIIYVDPETIAENHLEFSIDDENDEADETYETDETDVCEISFDEDDYTSWFEKPYVKNKKVAICLSFEEIPSH